MLAIDTSILVRSVTGDDPVASPRAREVIRANSIYLPVTVLLESEWVLRTVYRYGRQQILEVMTTLCAVPDAHIQHRDAFLDALDLYADGMDLADAIHLTSSADATAFVTFDRSLMRHATRSRFRLPVREP